MFLQRNLKVWQNLMWDVLGICWWILLKHWWSGGLRSAEYLTWLLSVHVVALMVQNAHSPCSMSDNSVYILKISADILYQIIWYRVGLRTEVFREGMFCFIFYRIKIQVISIGHVTWVSFFQDQSNIFIQPITPKSRFSSLLFTMELFRCILKWQFHFSKVLSECRFNFLSIFFSIGIKY